MSQDPVHHAADVAIEDGAAISRQVHRSQGPGLVLEFAWEVCNQVGRIYQVIRSKAPRWWSAGATGMSPWVPYEGTRGGTRARAHAGGRVGWPRPDAPERSARADGASRAVADQEGRR